MTRRLLAHGFAVGATAAAVLVTHLLWPKIQPGFFEFFLAGVILTAWWAGLGPALLATLLSVVAIDYYFVEPLHAVNLDVGNAIRLAVFAGVSLLRRSDGPVRGRLRPVGPRTACWRWSRTTCEAR